MGGELQVLSIPFFTKPGRQVKGHSGGIRHFHRLSPNAVTVWNGPYTVLDSSLVVHELPVCYGILTELVVLLVVKALIASPCLSRTISF